MTTAYKTFLLFMNTMGFGLSVWLLTLGIGLLMIKKWARRGSILYGWLGITVTILETAVNIIAYKLGWISVGEGELPGYIGGTCGGLIGGLIYPVLLLIFMKTDKVKQAFAGIENG